MKKINAIRKNISAIDRKLVSIIAGRQSYMPAVGKYKKENGLKINQPGREKEILVEMKKLSKQHRANPVLIEKIFKLIFKDSKKIQRRQ